MGKGGGYEHRRKFPLRLSSRNLQHFDISRESHLVIFFHGLTLYLLIADRNPGLSWGASETNLCKYYGLIKHPRAVHRLVAGDTTHYVIYPS